jgi:transposase, IS5 family
MEHKIYDFGSKASIVVTKNSRIIIGALKIGENTYDGNTLSATLSQVEALSMNKPSFIICDRGDRGVAEINGKKILIPQNVKENIHAIRKEKSPPHVQKKDSDRTLDRSTQVRLWADSQLSQGSHRRWC